MSAPFTGRLVPRDPKMFDPFNDRAVSLPPVRTCPPPPGQTAAATDVTPPASVAALSLSCPSRLGQDAAPGFGHTSTGAAFSVSLSPAVALILRLVETARPDLERDEIISRAIGVYAQQLGIPALARDLPDLPEFARNAPSRFRSGGP